MIYLTYTPLGHGLYITCIIAYNRLWVTGTGSLKADFGNLLDFMMQLQKLKVVYLHVQ